jgi:hypothetical protein
MKRTKEAEKEIKKKEEQEEKKKRNRMRGNACLL